MTEYITDEINGIRYRAIRKEPSDRSKKVEYFYSIAVDPKYAEMLAIQKWNHRAVVNNPARNYSGEN